MRLQLPLKKLIGAALVNQDMRIAGALGDKGRRVIVRPRRFIAAEIIRERLAPPRNLGRRNDRGEGQVLNRSGRLKWIVNAPWPPME